MGTVADATLAAGGTVVGIIPNALVEKEFAKRDCTELHVVETMHERKQMMAERAGAFLALAGGIGTFEELFEVWTWRQLGYHDKPVGILHGADATEVEIEEQGFRFMVHVKEGQKTGFFLDQRENRQAIVRYAKGRTLANCFSYTGGFSVYAASVAKRGHGPCVAERSSLTTGSPVL